MIEYETPGKRVVICVAVNAINGQLLLSPMDGRVKIWCASTDPHPFATASWSDVPATQGRHLRDSTRWYPFSRFKHSRP